MTWTEEFVRDDEKPDADVAEQYREVHLDDGDGLDVSHLVGAWERDASEADLIDQAITVPLPDVEYEFSY